MTKVTKDKSSRLQMMAKGRHGGVVGKEVVSAEGLCKLNRGGREGSGICWSSTLQTEVHRCSFTQVHRYSFTQVQLHTGAHPMGDVM